MTGNGRSLNTVLRRPVSEAPVVEIPHCAPSAQDVTALFQLRQKERSQDIRHRIAGSYIHPGVLVDLPPKKLLAIRTLVPQNFGAFHEVFIIDQQSPALAASDVLGLVKALCRKGATRTQVAAFVAS